MAPNQENRIGKLHTPLAPDTLALLSFNGMDAINECFEYQVVAQAANPDSIDYDDLLGQHMTVELLDRDLEPIYYDGIVVEAGFADDGDTGMVHRFVLRPWFWLLDQRVNQKIWQNMTFEEILDDVVGKFPGDFTLAYESRVTGVHTPKEYIVQYGESDMQFLVRLCERYGVNFHFEHSLGEHSLVLCDSNDSFPEIPGGSREYVDSQGDRNFENPHFWDWTPGRRLTVGKTYTTDYNFKTPTANMVKEHVVPGNYSNSEIETYHYPGIHLDGGEGAGVARMRTEQKRSRDAYHTAVGNTDSLKSGMRMTLEAEAHPADVDGKEFLCLRAVHSYSDGGYRSGGSSDGHAFLGSYEFAPADVPFAPDMKTPNTKMTGPQTALVVGPAGEEIHVDEYGRIKVQFYWDRLGTKDETSSMFVRVAQMWAGSGWGALFTPRIGMEVVVEFIEGDPNKPLVTGCVYNADNMPPYEQPGDKNWNGIKSESTIGGGGYNELVFNDTKGDELFRQHAQYDMETKVLHCERREVDVDRTTTIGNDEVRTVKHDETHVIENDSTWTIEGNHVKKVEKDETLTVTGDQKETVKKSRDITVDKSDKLLAKSDITIESKTKITLKVGMSKLVMDGSSITMSSPDIKIDAKASLETKSGITADHKAGGPMTIKGAIVKIN